MNAIGIDMKYGGILHDDHTFLLKKRDQRRDGELRSNESSGMIEENHVRGKERKLWKSLLGPREGNGLYMRSHFCNRLRIGLDQSVMWAKK